MRVSVALPVNVALLAALAAAVPPPVAALEPGVHVDPGSPAAKEYALPLSQARQTGASPPGGGRSSAPLFGAGIVAHRFGTPSHAGSRTSNSSAHLRGGGVSKATPTSRGSTFGAVSRASSGGSGSLLAVLGGAALILVIGTVGGVVLRGRRSAPSP